MIQSSCAHSLTCGTSMADIVKKCRQKIFEPLKPTTNPCRKIKYGMEGFQPLWNDKLYNGDIQDLSNVGNSQYLLLSLVSWEVAGLDTQHPVTTETQHVLHKYMGLLCTCMYRVNNPQCIPHKMCIIYWHLRTLLMLWCNYVFNTTCTLLSADLVLSVPGDAVSVWFLIEQLLVVEIVHQQSAVLVHHSQLCTTVCVCGYL